MLSVGRSGLAWPDLLGEGTGWCGIGDGAFRDGLCTGPRRPAPDFPGGIKR